jgi:hypothetical protein
LYKPDVQDDEAGPEGEAGGLLVRGRASSQVGRGTTPRKLNGQVYTPLPLAEAVVAEVRWPGRDSGGVLLDPACGDGVFLEAAVRKVLGAGLSTRVTRRLLAEGIVGWDLDEDALAAARRRLRGVLAGAGLQGVMPTLVQRDALVPDPDEAPGRFSCVVGNPPYLEAKRMPESLKARIRRHQPLAGRGAFDLYGAFVERALALARDDVALIVPNRILVAAWAAALRGRLLQAYDLSVTDLSRWRIFADAAVYPIVLQGRPARRPAYRTLQPRTDPAAAQDADPGAPMTPTTSGRRGGRPVRLSAEVLETRFGGMMPLAPRAPAGRRLLERVLGGDGFAPLSELVDVRWCVSFHRAGLRDAYLFPTRPEGRPLARPFLGGDRFSGNREVAPGRIEWAGWWIDYDEARARADGNPLPPRALFEGQKLVVCQNARRARAAIDTSGRVLKDTFLALVPRCRHGSDGLLAWLLLVLHSDLFHYLYEHLYAGTRKGGGYLHFLPRYLAPIPVPAPTPARSRRARALAAALADGAAVAAIHDEAEALVSKAYGLTAAERAAVTAYPMPPF